MVLPGDESGVPIAAAEDDEAAVSGKKTKRRRSRGKKIGIGVLVAVVLLAGAYVAAAWFLGDRVPGNTTVAGVDVSSLPVDEAERELTVGLADLEAAPIPVHLGDLSGELDPATAGLTFDPRATVESLTGFTLDPFIVIGHVFGLGERAPVTHVDEATLEQAVAALAQDLDVAPVEGSISFADGAAQVAAPVDGTSVEVEPAAQLIVEEWLTGERPFELPATVVEPTVNDEVIATAMSDVVEPLLSGSVTVAVNDTTTTIEPAELAAAATMEPQGAALRLVLDGQSLADVVTAKVPSIGSTPQDAQIVISGGAPTIIPAVTGTGLDPAAFADAVGSAAVATTPEGRVATIDLAQTEPEFSTADAQALGIVERISDFSTPMPYDPTRTENLVIGTSRINGTIVMPGETFSLLDALSPISLANGYNSSGVVVNGFVSEAAGGGLSQLSTTTFNAGFEAGMDDITHQTHSRWFTRYPEGREATLYEPDLDMQWRNNTDYGVLIQAWVADSRTHVALWGTNVWDVNITTGARSNITSPQTVYNTSTRCEPESGGQNGFTVQVTRTRSQNGSVVDSKTYTTTYKPWNRVICGPAPSSTPATPTPAPDDLAEG